MQRRGRFSVRSSAAAIIGSNDDLLIELLIFFPAKSLIKFQLVSKQWQSVISSPSFRHLHTLHYNRRPKPQTSLLLRFSSSFFICHPTFKRLVPFSGFQHVDVLQSCNGLLLLRCGRKSCYVFNPTTMQARDLRPPKAFIGLCLAFDPSKSPHYKVFCFRSHIVLSVSVSVYESETHAWTDRPVESCLEVGRFCDGVYWNGSVYFIKSHGTSRRFSLEDERVYRLPISPRAMSKKHHIIETNGHMHSVLLSDNYLYVYELSDVDFGWSTKYFADLKPVWATFGAENRSRISLLGMIREERVENSMLLVHVPGKIMIYRFLTKTFEVLVDLSRESYFEEGRLQFDFWTAHQFIESLAPV
ncbi:F-box protein at5g07610 [Phtheirospermum japonicum]|uniref:F-box protein at5g07610 n=1 Tax=Phtheirospermum japonicum TaxID=374723 RepID=A0A830BIY8_9LAMI|nr:F-box protein at5g07610 [Phtheirospermum japonicum]